MTFTLGTLNLVNPHEFLPEPYRVDRSNVMADGSLKFDVIAIKHRFHLKWEYLDGADYAKIKALYDANQTYKFTYPYNGYPVTKTVWVSACHPGSMVSVTPELYAGVTVELAEV